MNRVHLLVGFFRTILLILTASFTDAKLPKSDVVELPHSQLTIAAEDHTLLTQQSHYIELQDGGPAQYTAFDPMHDLRQALDVMQSTWFTVWVGTWPTAIDWTRAVIDTYLVSTLSSLSKVLHGKECLHDSCHFDFTTSKQIENEINRYFAQNIAYYFGEDAFTIRNEAYDDMLWVVLGWLESMKFIRTHSRLYDSLAIPDSNEEQRQLWHGNQFVSGYAHRARVFYDLAARGYDTKYCGGGMTWNPFLGPYKNAVTNELFIAASAGMYLYFPGDNNSSPLLVNEAEGFGIHSSKPYNPEYLKAAVVAYDWLKASNMTNKKGLYVDGFHISNWRTNGTKCDLRNEMVYTYNQGVLLSALRGLWEGTGNRTYLEDGHKLVQNVMKATGWLVDMSAAQETDEWHGLGHNGVLEDHCDAPGHCNQDAQTFKGIFFHHLSLLCEPLPLRPVTPGKTVAADNPLAFLHRQSCNGYTAWVAHNAKAALETRNRKGRFGMWWGAHSGVETAPLPEGAIDNRNKPAELLNSLWTLADHPLRSTFGEPYESRYDQYTHGEPDAGVLERDILEHSNVEIQDNRATDSDLNDRGRGRTVETQGGGVAVLRALWELLNAA